MIDLLDQAMKALQEKLVETRAAFAPKARFTFKTARKNPSAVSISDAAELAAQRRRHVPGYRSSNASSIESSISATPYYLRTPENERSLHTSPQPIPPAPPSTAVGPAPPFMDQPATEAIESGHSSTSTFVTIGRPIFSAATSVSLSHQSSAHVILPSSPDHASIPCSLNQIRNCVVDMSVPTTNGSPFAGLTIKNARKSLLVCGQVDGAAHITDAEESVIVVRCRQFRMHECKNVDVYLSCSSRPIIEDCSGIKFAKTPKTYVSHAEEN